MSNSIIKLYAQSFVDLVNENYLQETIQELDLLIQVFLSLQDVVKAAQFDSAIQKSFIDGIVKSKTFGNNLVNLIKLLAQNSRLDLATNVAKYSISLINKRLAIKELQISTPYELDKNTKEKLEKKIGKILGTKLHANYTIDESLIGGLKLFVDGKEYDATILGKINNFKNSVFKKIELI